MGERICHYSQQEVETLFRYFDNPPPEAFALIKKECERRGTTYYKLINKIDWSTVFICFLYILIIYLLRI